MLPPIQTLLACLIFLMPVRGAFALEPIHDDILPNLFFFLKPAPSEMPNLSLVCKAWHKVLNDDSLWTKFLEQDFGLSIAQLRQNSECIKAYYFRLKKELSTVEDLLALKSWSKEKMIEVLTSDESDKIEIVLSRHLERAVIKEARLLDVNSPVKLESFFYAYYETISDLIVELYDVAKNITEAIVFNINNEVARMGSLQLISRYLVEEGMWALAANGIRNAAHKGFTKKKPEDFYCQVGEHIRQRILKSGYHEKSHEAIEKRFVEENIPFGILIEQAPEKIAIIVAKMVSFYWLASLSQPEHLSTYFREAYFFALKDAETMLKAIEEKFPHQQFLKEHVMENIGDTAWSIEFNNNPHAQSFKAIMETIAYPKDVEARASEKK